MQIKLNFDGNVRDDLDWEDVGVLEAELIGKSRFIIARYCTDENNIPIPYDEAVKLLAKVKLPQINEYVQGFLKLIKDGAVNPTNAAKS